MSVFALLMEPANYTLDLIRFIYVPRQVAYAFQFERSKASSEQIVSVPVTEKMSLREKLCFFWKQLKAHDIFIVNGYTGVTNTLIILLNAFFFRKPMGFDSDTELRLPRDSGRRLFKRVYLGWLFQRSWSYGLAGGNFSHKELFRHYGMREAHIFLTPMMVNNALYAREAREFPKEIFHFGYVGRLVQLKQVSKILEAFSSLLAMGLRVELHIVGAGEERVSLEEKASTMQGVHFYGALFGRAKSEALQRIDALILYSSYESWGLVINEALAAGIPCIVSDRVGARNDLILGEHPTGRVVPWNSVDALSEAMYAMATEREVYEYLSRNAVKRMASWDYELYGRSFDGFLRAAGVKQ